MLNECRLKTLVVSCLIATASGLVAQPALAQLQFQISAQGSATPASIQSALQSLNLSPSMKIPLLKLYADLGYQPLFVNGSSLSPLAAELRSSLAKIREQGLELGDYWTSAHEQIFANGSNLPNAAAAEILLAETYVAACVHINIGRVAGAQASSINKMAPRSFTDMNVLESGVRGAGIAATFDALAPKIEGYQRLRGAMIHMLTILRDRVSASQILEVQLNMEKYRWIPNDPGPRYLTVNTAMQMLRLTDPSNTNPKLTEMRTINGKADHATPSWVDRVGSLEINPPWHVTPNIFAREKYPDIRAIAQTGNLEALRQWFDQRNFILIAAGTGQLVDPTTVDWLNYDPKSALVILTERPNYMASLGVVKFNLQNPPGPFYLHDTDTRPAFADAFRLLSHGCIRVQNPIDLAEYLLAGSGWDRARIEAMVLKPGEVSTLTVSTPLVIPKQNRIPIYILNLTADVGLDGVVHFAKDAYHDTANVYAALRSSGYLRPYSGAVILPGPL